ncbi:MAG TPA: 5-formyltetrahydrofolate cyclo-ligase [Nitrososphaeraceae archaeon]|jgi:5-formyltetrahydrofolate cyclo-ligase|nr:5-formyltetrahydrofolate cyclo-ligase [Nitrososphaeraceae archaeon]
MRIEMLKKRNALSMSEISSRSAVIQNHVINSSQFKSASTIGAYLPIGSEVRTEGIIGTALDNQKVVVLPKTGPDKIAFFPIFQTDFIENKLVKGKFGILEPLGSSCEYYNNIDLLIVPGVGFDKFGYRMGYGKGYYDRFMKENDFRFSIGLAFQFQVLRSRLPHSGYDQRLDAIATEKNMLVCEP